jgi:transcriptional regulator with XRE-family HTH domain
MGISLTAPPPDTDVSSADIRLAARLAALRQEHGWSLDALADRSGISRATLSRIERGETSPTAALLGRLCTAYNRTLSRLLAEIETDAPRLVRQADQLLWVDPETGFRRRSISPPAQGCNGELIEGELPMGATISYDGPPIPGIEQHVWMLGGRLDLTVDSVIYALAAGDCLRYRLFGPSRFHCPGPAPARYVIAFCRP